MDDQTPDLTAADIEIPPYGVIDPQAVQALAMRNMLLASHNHALEVTCQQLKLQVEQLKAKLSGSEAQAA